MEPQIGSTLLSRDALRRAETQVRKDVEGVRDEIGFSIVSYPLPTQAMIITNGRFTAPQLGM